MISGVVASVLAISLYFSTYGTDLSDDAFDWITLVISAEIGLVITLIVEHNSNLAHKKEVALLKRLEKTDEKHNEALTALNNSQKLNEEFAEKSLLTTLQYVIDMLNKLFKHVNPDKLKTEDNDLVINLLKHLESPLNLMMQSVQQTGSRLVEQKNDIISNTEDLRKLVIAAAVVGNAETKRTVDLLKKIKENLEQIQINVSGSN